MMEQARQMALAEIVADAEQLPSEVEISLFGGRQPAVGCQLLALFKPLKILFNSRKPLIDNKIRRGLGLLYTGPIIKPKELIKIDQCFSSLLRRFNFFMAGKICIEVINKTFDDGICAGGATKRELAPSIPDQLQLPTTGAAVLLRCNLETIQRIFEHLGGFPRNQSTTDTDVHRPACGFPVLYPALL
ncbi:MAG: hypothetical protein KatS3mg057_1679 [Herpetosiphonaceae bacterium]|nr:MAG: hypothetical protein KatS3mg057_1679 [Herpetosiphonaceae bacterium]